MGYKIGIIGGTGWIGKGVAVGLLKSGCLKKSELIVSNRSGTISEHPELKSVSVTADNQALIDQSDIIIFSVSPKDFSDLKVNAKGKVVISVMAGVTCKRIKTITHSTRIIRTMPNAAAEIQQSYTPWFSTIALPNEEKQNIKKILACFGKEQEVKAEDDINFFTALTGSGHGTVALLETALINAALDHGVDKDIAQAAVKQLFDGMGRLLNEPECEPAKDVQKVIEYAGTTAALVLKMQEQGIDKVVEEGIEAGYRKASSDMSQ